MFWRIKRTNFIIVLAASLAVAFVTTARAAIINVPGDQPTIQTAINIAVNGDEIIVAPGTYFETINFLGKAIIVRSTDPDDPAVVQSTIINGNGAGSVVGCTNGEGPDTVLSGFVITGGSGAACGGGATCGGGMYNVNSSPTVTNCSFIRNTASKRGGGMYNENSNPTVTNCSFTENSAKGIGIGSVGVKGGGMYNINSSPTLTNCSFTLNVASAFDTCGGSSENVNVRGGGMYNENGSPTMTDCSFTGNRATAVTRASGGGSAFAAGGGFYNVTGNPTLTNCTFNGNSTFATSSCHTDDVVSVGGGMYDGNGSTTLTNCTFIGNSVSGMAVSDAGLELSGGGIKTTGNTTITDSQICGNVPDQINGSYNNGGGNEINMTCPPVSPPCPGDLDGDGTVSTSDLLALFANWGPCKK